MNRDALLDTALAAAGRGWHVFPLRPGDKRPACPDHVAERCTGSDPRCRAAGRHVPWEIRATCDPDRIRRAWSARPYNVGIACGPSGLVVVDLDTRKPNAAPPAGFEEYRHGEQVFADRCRTAGRPVPADTFTVATPTGGIHCYYTYLAEGTPLRNTGGSKGAGLGWLVDTRAWGGFVVAAGSLIAGRAYTVVRDVDPPPLPDWLAALLRPAPLRPTRPTVARLGGRGRRAAYLRASVDKQVAYLTAATSYRNEALFQSAANLGELVAGGALDRTYVEDVLTNAAHSIGLHLDPPPGQIPRTIASGLRAGARRPRSVPEG